MQKKFDVNNKIIKINYQAINLNIKLIWNKIFII